MAPPSPRRPGFSRRAQYSLFTGYVIAVGGIVFGILMLITARLDPDGHAAIQQRASDVFAPVSGAFRTALGGMGSVGEAIGAYIDAGSKNQALETELKKTRAEAMAGKQAMLENARLKRLLALNERVGAPIANARLVSSTGSIARRYATIDVGWPQGIRNGMPVIGPEGLVGRITQTGRNTSRVLLIIDAGAVIPVKRLSDGLPALANGLGDGRLEIRPLTAGNNPLRPRDVFVTSGTGGIYRPGIPVAMALKPSRDGAMGRPLADPARFDFATVEPEYVMPPPPPPEILGQP
jgi:rod shape-determining protein MreC